MNKDKKNNPLVSVIIPSYNHEKYIEETILSVVNQSYTNIELIVIDDGSIDESPNIIEKLSKQYRFFYERHNNIGLPKTLNKAIKYAKGEYVSICASDDIFFPDKIEVLMKQLIELDESYCMVCGDAMFIGNQGEDIEKVQNDKLFKTFIDYYSYGFKEFNLKKEFGQYKTFLLCNYIPAMSVVIRKQNLYDVGLFDENIILEDWNMWLKLSKNWKFKYIDSVVAKYRLHNTNSISTLMDKINIALLNIIKKEKKYCYKNDLKLLWNLSFARLSKIMFFKINFMTSILNIIKLNVICLLKLFIKKQMKNR